MYQSSPAVPIPPPPPRATAGHLLKLSVLGVGHSRGIRNFIAAKSQPGGWALVYPGANPRAFDTRVKEFIGKDKAFVKDWLVCHGLEKLVDVFKVCFLNCKYFFIYTCEHMNISDKVNFILFITTQSLT